ncbi:error-prone DNA polymerase [Blastopirellula marina]|uniref:Error-prone DNA polymerase n=1 Tax=Blastopirellula marina TaxID=124 RepID=A0A2S8F9Y2_9BACT|nr:error-prone DNA polymerase [Blastopirellula marina]PQO28951.1 error-prone DNA polymerase [Blastopirellula marina]PTL42224.1 error-prone DNA polymerase [Blastopirellula marina]
MRYAELHCLTNFSFLEAASHPEELVTQAKELGYSALAITDRNMLAGVVRAHTAAKDHGLKILIGAEIRPVDGPPVVLWATNREGYANLCRMITLGRRQAPKGECRLTVEEVARHTAGLLGGIVPAVQSEPMEFEDLHRYREIYGESAYLLAELHHGPHDHERLAWLRDCSRKTSLPLVAAGNVLFHMSARKPLHDVLTAIRLRSTVARVGEHLLPNAERHLRSLERLQAIFSNVPEAIHRTQEIADQCTFSLNELRYEYPEELAPPGLTPMQYLRELTWEGAAQRFPEGVSDKVRQLLEHELRLIEELHYEPYFLTVWDLMRFARSRGILCQGRGSAANSVVCYCLEVTSVNPERVNVLFERFISRERDEAPDIDVDFEHERREEVLQYIYEKYGRDRAGIAAVTITYRPRSAIRDVGKALGLSLDMVDRLAKNADHYRATTDFAKRCGEMGLDACSDLGKQFLYLVKELLGFPRHLSQHTGGMVITRGPLHDLVPIENAAMQGRTVVQWNKDDLDDLGILKVDCLALGMLTAIRKMFQMVEANTGKKLTLANIPEGDEKVYDMICRADTIGVFQIESRAQMSMLPRLRPRCYYDLVIEVAIVRPGPIQGDMVHPYLRRRFGEEEVTYPNEAIREVLKKTLGVPLFQEQCMQLAIVAAGFTPGEADQLRRAMGAWRRPGIIDQFRRKLLDGMQKHGLEGDFAERVFQQIRGFGEYGFPESHAASFALLVYVSCWLKHYYPAEFAAAIINSQPMGFYAPAQLISDARNHNVSIFPVDVNRSNWDCTTENRGIRLGMRLVGGLPQAVAETISHARQDRPFASLVDFTHRTNLPQAQVERLADADALASLEGSRRDALWDALSLGKQPRQRWLFENDPFDEPPAILPTMSAEEEVYADYRTTGLSLRSHPIAFQRERLNRLQVTPASALSRIPNESSVRVAGIVLLRQRPSTAKGITFVTLEDETGVVNLVVHHKTWERFRKITRHSQAWIAHGKLETKHTVIHVIVRRLEDLAGRVHALGLKSRDFR